MARTYTVGPFRLDAAAEVLFRGAEPIALGQRAVALLRVLVERAGEVVSKETLLDAAWPGISVEESNLTVQVATLRRTLGEGPGGERWIETLPRRGYRFVGPVEAPGEGPPIPDLGARQLAAVLAVAEHKSFNAAAAALRTSQPALIRTIRRVEDVLGVRLFERSTQRIQMTTAGKEFVAVAERMTNDLRIAVRSMRDLAEEQRGQVILASIISIANGRLPRMIARYRATRPGIEIQVREGVHGAVTEDVRSGVADFGITYLEDLPDALDVVSLGREVFELVVPRGHPLADRRRLSIEDLAGVPLVSLPLDSQTRRALDGTAHAKGVALDHAVIVSQIMTMLSFVRAGVGVAVTPSTAVADLLGERLVRVRLREPGLSRAIGAVTLKERGLTPAAMGLLQVVRQNWEADKA
jgi:DNA-binding transcriptional LysR family regulator